MSKAFKPKPAAALFKRWLPKDFKEKSALINQLQQLFLAQSSDAVFQMVTVCNVTESYLSLSVPNPPLAAYLRLHSDQVRQLIEENFGLSLELKISARPDSTVREDGAGYTVAASEVSEVACEQIRKSADSLDDEDLRHALQSLSKTLSKKFNG